jgi:hypothetical protein
MPGKRSSLPRDAARRKYVERAALIVLETIRSDAAALDRDQLAIGPFARLDAGTVAARDGKTRGALSNLFGSQAALQIETMALALEATDLVKAADYPSPEDHDTAEAWVDAFFAAESRRGPAHRRRPTLDYASLWALWLAAVPYGAWSDRVSRPSLEEFRTSVTELEPLLRRALDQFELDLVADTTLTDLAVAITNLVEGAWLNQCLTSDHPLESDQPIAEALRRSGRLLWRGATRARAS